MSVFGSTMAVLITPDRIIIAADSVLTAVTNGSSSFNNKICKIRREGNTFYGAVGDDGVPGTKTDVWEIARTSIGSVKTIRNIYATVEPAIFGVLPEIVERNKVGDPKLYSKWLNGVPVISVTFARFEKGQPIVVSFDFKIDEKGIPTEQKPTILGPIRGKLNTGRLGYHAQMDAAINSPGWSRRFSTDPIETSRDLIQREIDASTREKRYDVGLPISIASITINSAELLRGYEGVCPINKAKSERRAR